MNSDSQWLIAKTREGLRLREDQPISLSPILKGGSERCFFRCDVTGADSCILMQYSTERAENHLYVDIARFLNTLGVSAPRIYGSNEDHRLIWLEDLGEEDLFNQRHKPWPNRLPGYRLALDEIRLLHDKGLAVWRQNEVKLMDGFGPELYQWEHNYFFDNFVQDFCRLTPDRSASSKLGRELNDLIERLNEAPVSLIHRDFQSQNIMLHQGRACLIDFQGLRQGVCYYDLGSLLYDPYVDIPEDGRDELLDYYFQGRSEVRRRQLFHEAGAQRLMQALGAYGFLGLKKGKKNFLQHIPAALRNLGIAAAASGRLSALADLVEPCTEAAAAKIPPVQRHPEPSL